jgi:outer membrane protein assembly factor BamB
MRTAHRTTCALVGCVLLLGAAGARAQDWPQWRGPNRDSKVTGFTAPATWPKELTQKWQVTVGLGDASPALVGDRLYTFTRKGNDEVVTCLEASDGKVVWQKKYAAAAVTGPASRHPGPRSSPAVAEGKVCTLGVAGVLSCLDAANGKVLWQHDSKAWPMFFTASSPLIVDGKCVAYLGGRGKGEVVAYDLNSGAETWKWSGDAPAYGSPVVMTVDSVKQVVTLTEKGLVGINAADGKLLWRAKFSAQYNSGTPVVDGQTVIVSGPAGRRGGGGGTAAFKIEKQGDGFAAREVWHKDQAAAMYNTPVLKNGLLYGLAPGRGGRGPTNLFCMNAQTGAVIWKDSSQHGECGEVLDAGSVLLALSSDGNLLVFKPGDKDYEQVASYKVADKGGLDGPWAYPVVSGNRVFVKDRDKLTLWAIP